MESPKFIETILDHERYSDEIEYLKKNISMLLNPPIERECHSDTIRGFPNIPPQPCQEYIDIKKLEKIGKKIPYAFMYLDELVSLMPTELYEKLLVEGWGEKHEEFEEKFLTNLIWLQDTNLNLYPEDSTKQYILLFIPSNKLFKHVWGKWDSWVWRDRTLGGDPTPNEEGWTADIVRIAEKLNEESIGCIIGIEKDVATDNLEIYKDVFYNPLNRIVKIPINIGKPKIGYVRDQSITITPSPIIGNMALDIRRGEERIIIDLYRKIGTNPILRARWIVIKNRLMLTKLEGGNIFYIETDKGGWLLTGIGVRGSDLATLRFLRDIMPEDIKVIGIPLSGYIKKWSETGAVHLDVVMTYLGEVNGTYYAVLDPMRIGFYSAIEINKDYELEIHPIPKLFKEMGVYIDEIPGKEGSKITMANALNLGKGKLLVDKFNTTVNKFLVQEFGADVIEIDIPHLEAGGGGVRCSTKELWEIH